jgi:hypothetical protein
MRNSSAAYKRGSDIFCIHRFLSFFLHFLKQKTVTGRVTDQDLNLYSMLRLQ